MNLLVVNNDGNMAALSESELFDLWLYFYDMAARNVVEVVEDPDAAE